MKYKVAVDTNLFIATYYNPNSASAQIINMIARGELIFVWTEAIKKEIDRILSNIKAKQKYFNKVNAKILRPGHLVLPQVQIEEVCEDSADNKFLEAALAGEVDYIISSDKHLLDLKSFKNIPILTPNDFWKIIKS
ncbi:putative toxin-antitoxin system toxin component, PIN family [Patescibacteria group bacterium]|nr:putative toxin-antitoxin system toxin component, PIN family [Patescibacteria group bacterium]MBU1922306.1 putative toxin-antitoxin system toxin component, PIN family [Patescibacteria group bacterium]